MSIYTTGMERALAGSRSDIAGQSILRVQRGIHRLKEIIIPLHQATHKGGELSDIQVAELHEAQARRSELHAKNHELLRIMKAGSPSPELELATQGIWNWGITSTENTTEPDAA